VSADGGIGALREARYGVCSGESRVGLECEEVCLRMDMERV
jgi:hypothetical protein